MAALKARHPTATLVNGDMVTTNDHVYFAPPWSERDGSPYTIARIIEFVPSTAIKHPGGASSRKKINRERHVRLGLFYRQSELSGRQPADIRLLLGAIHTEVHPLSWLRGKCYVRHRDRIEDLVEWKRRPDCFWFQRLFDPWIKREYEVVGVGGILNVPLDVKRTLSERYEFIVTEKEMVVDLTDSFRTCGTCDEWASSLDSVKCETCKVHYHMSCVRPVLAVKPSKGYSWMCAPCIYEHHRKAASEAQRHGMSNGNASASGSGSAGIFPHQVLPPGLATTLLTSPPSAGPRGSASHSRTKIKDSARTKLPPPPPPDYDRPDRTFRGWPFRYFGLYTVAQDTLDPDDPIFPRTAIRLGVRYQATVPTWEEQSLTAEIEDDELPRRGLDDGSTAFLTSRPNPHREQRELNQVGGDAALKPGIQIAVTQYIRRARALVLPVPPDSVERYDLALRHFTAHTGGSTVALAALERSQASDFRVVKDLTPKELEIFERQVDKWGSLEQHETAKMLSRKPADVIRIYYRWRNAKLAQARVEPPKTASSQAKASAPKAKSAKSRTSRTIVGGSSILGTHREMTPESDAEGSTWEEDRLKSAKPACSCCSTRKSVKWWKTPRSQVGEHLCENCGSSYRKYGVAIPTKPTIEIGRGSKREGTPLEKEAAKKLLKTNAQAAMEAVAATIKLQPCILCRRPDPKIIARCKNCTFSIHPGCYGIPKEDVTPDWLCEPCSNELSLESALDASCVLCPTHAPNVTRPIKNRPKIPPDFDYLHAVKPTEGYKWAHVLCSTFVSDVVFTDAGRLRSVESIMTLPTKRWLDQCDICKSGGGVVIDCSGDGCERKFHASCGWRAGLRFGFEFTMPVTNRLTKREIVVTATFKNANGQMAAQCFCPDHELEDRQIFDLYDYDADTGETALQVYARTYKQVNTADSFGQLRKAKRIEAIMDSIPDSVIIDTNTTAATPSPGIVNVKNGTPRKTGLISNTDRTMNGADGLETEPEFRHGNCFLCAVEVSPRWYSPGEMRPIVVEARIRICHECYFRRKREMEMDEEEEEEFREREDRAAAAENRLAATGAEVRATSRVDEGGGGGGDIAGAGTSAFMEVDS